jgi:hypothetical protein
MEAYDAQVRDLKADKARLVDENKALLNRKSILEKVLTLKEEQIQVLQEGAGVRARSPAPSRHGVHPVFSPQALLRNKFPSFSRRDRASFDRSHSGALCNCVTFAATSSAASHAREATKSAAFAESVLQWSAHHVKNCRGCRGLVRIVNAAVPGTRTCACRGRTRTGEVLQCMRLIRSRTTATDDELFAAMKQAIIVTIDSVFLVDSALLC